MIGRAEKRATEFAARDVGKVSLDRLGLSNVDLVKIRLCQPERAPLKKFPIGRDRAIFAELK